MKRADEPRQGVEALAGEGAVGRNGAPARPFLSVIVPVLNEAVATRAALENLRAACPDAEIVVVDGKSADRTAAIARPLCDRLIEAQAGRARQLNAGASAARGDVLLFVHIDTLLPAGAGRAVVASLASGPGWGRFDVAISGKSRLLPGVAWAMNRRSRLTGVATGDQAIFVSRRLFCQVGGFPDIPLMEDVALSKTLRARAAPICLRERVTTAGRRWDANGPIRTILTMALLRLLYWAGVAPDRLALVYAMLKRG